MKKVIAQVIGEMEFGGAEQVVLDIVSSLDKSRYSSVVIVLCDPGSVGEQVRASGVKLLHLDKRPGFDPGLIGRLCRMLKEQRVDLVHAHLFSAQLWGRIAAGLLDLPLIVHHHNIYKWNDRIRPFLDRYLPYHRCLHVGVSKAALDDVQKVIKAPEEKLRVIYNGITIPDELPSSDRPGGEVVKGLWAGRMVVQKNLMRMVEAVRILKNRIGSVFQIDLLGDGPDREVVETEIRKNDLSDVLLVQGRQSDVQKWMAEADFFTLSSDIEGLPIVLLEAGINGLPSVVTDAGGNAEIIRDGENGYVTEQDSVGLAEKLEKIVIDRAKRLEMGKAAQERIISDFDIIEICKQLGKCYSELI